MTVIERNKNCSPLIVARGVHCGMWTKGLESLQNNLQVEIFISNHGCTISRFDFF